MKTKRPRRLVLINPKHTTCMLFAEERNGNDVMSIAFTQGKGRQVTLQLGPQHAADLVAEIVDWLPHMKQSRGGH